MHIAVDETTTEDELSLVVEAFGFDPRTEVPVDARASCPRACPSRCAARASYLEHPVFNTHQSETQMMRYLKQLADRDYALDRGMIPLGSCTMKLNAATEMQSVTWPEFANLHPFAPEADVEGTLGLIEQLESWLAEVTGYDTVSLQPNAGSQGELAGLLAIRGYHRANGDVDRDLCLIPSSAHGTNAASAVLAGMRVVVVACDELGNVDLDDLRAKIAEHADRIAALMITYPSTHGVYEHEVQADHAGRARRRRPGLRRRREPQRAARLSRASATSAATSRTSTCTRRSASRTAAADRASVPSRRRRTSRRTCPGIRSRSAPTTRAASRTTAAPCRRRPTAARRSCRSRGRTCA